MSLHDAVHFFCDVRLTYKYNFRYLIELHVGSSSCWNGREKEKWKCEPWGKIGKLKLSIHLRLSWEEGKDMQNESHVKIIDFIYIYEIVDFISECEEVTKVDDWVDEEHSLQLQLMRREKARHRSENISLERWRKMRVRKRMIFVSLLLSHLRHTFIINSSSLFFLIIIFLETLFASRAVSARVHVSSRQLNAPFQHVKSTHHIFNRFSSDIHTLTLILRMSLCRLWFCWYRANLYHFHVT